MKLILESADGVLPAVLPGAEGDSARFKKGGGTHRAEHQDSGDPLLSFLLQHMKTCCRLNVMSWQFFHT